MQKTPFLGSFAVKIALKNATKNATSKKETLESQCYQGFAIVNVIRIGFEPMTRSLEGWCSIQLSYRTSTQLYFL